MTRRQAQGLALALLVSAVGPSVATSARSHPSVAELHRREHRIVYRVEKAKETLRWFEHHPHVMYMAATKRKAWRDIHAARVRIVDGRAELLRVRALIARYDRPLSAREAIRLVFGPYADQALRVAACETGGTFSVYAHNGQYLGLFQMGDYARSRYGHSWTPLGQARAAYRYFVDSGRDWSPWSCKP